MSNWEIFLWGAVGSFLSYLAIYALPQLRDLYTAKDQRIPKGRFVLLIVIGAVMVEGGSLFAVIIGDATRPKHAAFYGAGWEAGIKGVASVARLPFRGK